MLFRKSLIFYWSQVLRFVVLWKRYDGAHHIIKVNKKKEYDKSYYLYHFTINPLWFCCLFSIVFTLYITSLQCALLVCVTSWLLFSHLFHLRSMNFLIMKWQRNRIVYKEGGDDNYDGGEDDESTKQRNFLIMTHSQCIISLEWFLIWPEKKNQIKGKPNQFVETINKAWAMVFCGLKRLACSTWVRVFASFPLFFFMYFYSFSYSLVHGSTFVLASASSRFSRRSYNERGR